MGIFWGNFLTYNLLTIASFRIGVPSILFFLKINDMCMNSAHWTVYANLWTLFVFIHFHFEISKTKGFWSDNGWCERAGARTITYSSMLEPVMRYLGSSMQGQSKKIAVSLHTVYRKETQLFLTEILMNFTPKKVGIYCLEFKIHLDEFFKLHVMFQISSL